MTPNVVLDLTGLECPQPAIRTKKRLKTMKTGEVLEAICSDPLTRIDIPHLARQLGHELVAQDTTGQPLRFWIRLI